MLKHHVHRSHTEHGLCKSCLKLHSESVTCEQCGYSHVCPQVVRKHIRRGINCYEIYFIQVPFFKEKTFCYKN